MSYNPSPLWRRGGGEERVHSNLSNKSFRSQAWFLALLCSTLSGCLGLPAGQESAVVTMAQMQMGTLGKITAGGPGKDLAVHWGFPRSGRTRRMEGLRCYLGRTRQL